MLMGDFNFDSSRNFHRNDKDELENNSIALYYPEYKDLWAYLNPKEHGKEREREGGLK